MLTAESTRPDLARQLEAAQHDVERLTAENEALMDISNALTAEKRQAAERCEHAAKQGKRNQSTLTICIISACWHSTPDLSALSGCEEIADLSAMLILG